MNVIWADKARADLAEITDFYIVAPRFLSRLLFAVDEVTLRLIEHPESGQSIPAKPLRKMLLRPSKYLLFYRKADSGLEIARILHGERDWFTEL